MTGGRAPKRRGYYYEKRIEALLAPYGFKRMVMSGALGGDHGGDLRGLAHRSLVVVEVKRRAGGQRNLRRWLCQGNADCLVLPGDRGEEPLVVMTGPDLCELLAEAGYRLEDSDAPRPSLAPR